MLEQKVLDHGYVKLIGIMISESDDKNCAQTLDEMVVEAARISYGGGLKGPEKDRKLLHYLIEHEHGTPLEMAVFKFEIKCPIFVFRQWVRHRWSSFSEISGRYTEEIADEFYMPKEFRVQDQKNKQGSTPGQIASIQLTTPEALRITQGQTHSVGAAAYYHVALLHQQEEYKRLIEAGVARELARGVLGTAFYTQVVWTVNARSLMNFLILRCESHAQWEIRQYADALLTMFKEKMPWTAESTIKLFPSSFMEQQ